MADEFNVEEVEDDDEITVVEEVTKVSRVVSGENLEVGDIVGDFVVKEVAIRGENRRSVWLERKA